MLRLERDHLIIAESLEHLMQETLAPVAQAWPNVRAPEEPEIFKTLWLRAIQGNWETPPASQAEATIVAALASQAEAGATRRRGRH